MEENKNQGLPGAPAPGVIDGHEYVDLGLSVLWATCNIGASSPDDYGRYFAWGETEPKDEYTKENYLGQGKTRLGPDDDPAQVHWGDRWRMPTRSELDELIHQCDWDVHWRSGEKPYCQVTSKRNGNSLILPRGGYRDVKGLHEGDVKGHFWLNSSLDEGACNAPCLSVDYCHSWECDMIEHGHLSRYLGVPVRPVAKKADIHPDPEDIIRIQNMPKLIRVALDKFEQKPEELLGYRMVFQRKGIWDAKSSLEDEIRLVDGSEFTRPAKGRFEHAFFQLCLPMVHYNYRTVQLSSCESRSYVDGIERTRYWTDRLVDVPGGEEEARRCLEWLREWVGSHRKPDRILEAETVADDLRRKGRRVPVKMHICYMDVPDPENHGWCTPRLARGHQDMVAWDNEEGLEKMKPDYLLAGDICGYDSETLILAKMQLDETLGIDCEWLKVDVRWVKSEFERLTRGMRFLTAKDIELLRRRLASHGPGITPEALYKGLDHVYVRRTCWSRTEPWPHEKFVVYHLLSDSFSPEDDDWDVYSKALPLNGFSVEEMAELLTKKPAGPA